MDDRWDHGHRTEIASSAIGRAGPVLSPADRQLHAPQAGGPAPEPDPDGSSSLQRDGDTAGYWATV